MRYWLIVVWLLPSLAGAEVYRWTDAGGQVHFGEVPAAGAVPVEVKPQVMQRDAATIEREQRTEQFFAARRQEQQRADELAQQRQAKQAEECQRLRGKLDQLARAGSFYRLDAQGQRVYYSDAEIAATRRQLTTQVANTCQ